MFGCPGSSLPYMGLLQLWQAGATLQLLCIWASYWSGFSCCGAQAPGAQASVVAAYGLTGSVVAAYGLSSCCIQAHGLSSSYIRAQQLLHTGSRAQQLLHTGSRAQQLRLKSARVQARCGARGQLPRGVWDLPVPGIKPVYLAVKGGLLSTEPQESHLIQVFSLE